MHKPVVWIVLHSSELSGIKTAFVPITTKMTSGLSNQWLSEDFCCCNKKGISYTNLSYRKPEGWWEIDDVEEVISLGHSGLNYLTETWRAKLKIKEANTKLMDLLNCILL